MSKNHHPLQGSTGKRVHKSKKREPSKASRFWPYFGLVGGLLLGAAVLVGRGNRTPSPTTPSPTPTTSQPSFPMATPIPPPLGYKPSYVGGPRLEVEKPDLDLGTLVYEQHVVATWTVRNVGDATLTMRPPAIAKTLEGC
ncbi:MAG: hypothetical protein HY871_06680 [Chloroflexi bacterium]|nr:hypothetical protein [Chloroflexota bacterium]